MRDKLHLTAADGHRLGAYRADPAGSARGAIVVIQEIFGVNRHIRAVCDSFAADGYVAVAPAMFDRVERDVDIGYTPDDIAKGRDLRAKLPNEPQMLDVAAAVADAAKGGLKVGIVGYCYGGTVAWVAAAKVAGLSAAAGYYGGGWGDFKALTPRCPTMLHFGARDAMIPVGLAEEFKMLHPQITTRVYDADHGFNCDQRGSYDAFAALIARRRTLGLFESAVAA